MPDEQSQSSRESWLQQRRSVVGASEVSALLGLNPYQSPADLYLAKVEGREIEETEFLRAGRLMEPVILQLVEEEWGWKVTPNSELVVHPDYPFMGCTPDGYIENGGVVECKNSSKLIEIPHYAHLAQLQYQMGITGRRWGLIGYFMQGYRYRSFRFDFRPEIFDQLVELASDFWHNHIIPRVPPEPIRPGDAAKLIRREVDGKIVEADAQARKLVARYQRLVGTIAARNGELAETRDQLQRLMRDAEALTVDGERVITWKRSADGTLFDLKQFARDYPELYREYLVLKEGRREFVLL
jgi:putative phage-type endonuclease